MYLSVCICGVIALLIYISDVSLLGPAFCRTLVVSAIVRMFELRTIESGFSKGAYGRTQIHPIWRN